MPYNTNFDPERLLRVAYRVAQGVLHNRFMAEEAGERALHQFNLACLSGAAPDCAEAWIRVVSRRFACSLRRSHWAQFGVLAEPDLHPVAGGGTGDGGTGDGGIGDEGGRRERIDRLWSQVVPVLSARQRDALAATRTCPTFLDAARQCRMTPRDLRRHLAAIRRKAGRLWPEPLDLATDALR